MIEETKKENRDDLASSEGHQPEPAKGRLSKAASFVVRLIRGQVKLPAIFVLLLAVITEVPDWNSRYEFWLQVAKNSGGFLGGIATVLLWPWTSVAIAAFGVALIVAFEARNRSLASNGPSVFFAWASFVVIVAAVGGTAAYGAIQAYVEKEIALGLAGVARNSASLTDPTRVQKPLTSASRYLLPDQIRVLLQVLPALKPEIPTLPVAYDWNDGEASSTYRTYQPAFSRSGILTTPMNRVPSGPNETGILLLVGDISKIPKAAEVLKADLEMASVYTRFAQFAAQPTVLPEQAILYIAPAPFL